MDPSSSDPELRSEGIRDKSIHASLRSRVCDLAHSTIEQACGNNVRLWSDTACASKRREHANLTAEVKQVYSSPEHATLLAMLAHINGVLEAIETMRDCGKALQKTAKLLEKI
jgi:anti-sigma factor RsiW